MTANPRCQAISGNRGALRGSSTYGACRAMGGAARQAEAIRAPYWGVGAGRFDEYAAFSTFEEPTSGNLSRFPPERALHLDEN
jgi:hypothetical protein